MVQGVLGFDPFRQDWPASFVACTFTTTTTTTTTTLRIYTCNCLYVYPSAGSRSLRVSCWTARCCRVRTHLRMSCSRPPLVLLCFDVYFRCYVLLCRHNCIRAESSSGHSRQTLSWCQVLLHVDWFLIDCTDLQQFTPLRFQAFRPLTVAPHATVSFGVPEALLACVRGGCSLRL